MKRRNWTANHKTQIVLSGLRGMPVGELCTEHGITQSQYYRWRDQFLANCPKAFEVNKESSVQARLRNENKRLKGVIGELTVELKKSEEWS